MNTRRTLYQLLRTVNAPTTPWHRREAAREELRRRVLARLCPILEKLPLPVPLPPFGDGKPS